MRSPVFLIRRPSGDVVNASQDVFNSYIINFKLI